MALPTRPPFLYPPGSPLMHPPLALTQASMYGFVVPGDAAALQASVDATLNQGSGGAMQFTVLCSTVLMTFTDIAKAYSQWPSDRAKGWGREVDVVAWVMVAGFAGDQFVGFYAYPRHIWVDDCMALIVGREVFGYPKYLCEYSMPAPDAPPTLFTLAAKGFQPYAEDTELAVHPILEIVGEPLLGLGQPVLDVQDWRGNLLQGLQQVPGDWVADPALRAPFEQWLLRGFPAMPQIFLKQFPDASGQQAVYQGIVSALASVQTIHRLSLLGSSYQLNLHDFASFPLATTLGWKLGAQRAYLGYRIDFDFVVEPGTELVCNGTYLGAG